MNADQKSHQERHRSLLSAVHEWCVVAVAGDRCAGVLQKIGGPTPLIHMMMGQEDLAHLGERYICLSERPENGFGFSGEARVDEERLLTLSVGVAVHKAGDPTHAFGHRFADR